MGFFSSIGGVLNDVLGTTSAMKAQNRQQWAMWNAQNAYNTPAAQMERLKEAGLNPMLVYGHGSVVGNTAGSMSAAAGSSGGGAGLLGAIVKSPWAAVKMYQDLKLGQEQIDQVKANKAVALATAGKINAEADILRNQIDNTVPGMDIGGSKGPIEKVIRGVYGVNKEFEKRRRDYIKRHTYNPSLPALGRNYRP